MVVWGRDVLSGESEQAPGAVAGDAAQSAEDSGVADDPAHYSGGVGGVQCVGAGDGPGRIESRRL